MDLSELGRLLVVAGIAMVQPLPSITAYRYHGLADAGGDQVLAYLEARYIPNLRRDLTVQRVFTPADFKGELNAHLGSAFSLEPILTQSAFFRTHNRDDRIPNLYFVGAGTHPGAGIPGVVGSAKATAGLMIEDMIA